MTIGEVTRELESFNRREQMRIKERAAFDYKLAELIGASVSRLFKGKYPEVYDAYPGIFERQPVRQQDWRIAKERLLQYSQQHNRKRKEGKT